MNEELQREILEILRNLKSGSNPVFQELLAQYSGKMLATAIAFYTFAAIGLCSSIFLKYYGHKVDKVRAEDPSGYYLACVIVAFVSTMVALAGTDYLLRYLYPLGGILAKLN